MENIESLVLYAQVSSTLFMVGLIWFVQIVHYPLMAVVGADRFEQYAALHRRRTTWVVAPAMLLEAATAVAFVYVHRVALPAGYAWVGMGLVFVIWISTAALQVPIHETLCTGYSAPHLERLVRTNWVRTVAWTARGTMLLVVVALTRPT